MAKSYQQIYTVQAQLQDLRESRRNAARDLIAIMAGIISLVLAAGYILSQYVH